MGWRVGWVGLGWDGMAGGWAAAQMLGRPKAYAHALPCSMVTVGGLAEFQHRHAPHTKNVLLPTRQEMQHLE